MPEKTPTPRPPLLTSEDRRTLVRMFLEWPFVPFNFIALGLAAEIQGRAAGVPEPEESRWKASARRLRRGFSVFWLLVVGLSPWAALLFLGLSWQLAGTSLLERGLGLALGSIALVWAVLFLPGWARLHGPAWKSVRPLWKAVASAAAWPFLGDAGYARALGRSLAGWAGWLAGTLFLGGTLAGSLGTLHSGGMAGWSLLVGYYLLPFPLAVTARAAGLWAAEEPRESTRARKKAPPAPGTVRRQVAPSKASRHTRHR